MSIVAFSITISALALNVAAGLFNYKEKNYLVASTNWFVAGVMFGQLVYNILIH